MTKQEIFKQERKNESICDFCGVEMDEVKAKKKNRYSKENTYYKCSICGHQHRKRTLNELARDCGFRN
jgi:hypothetical protein